MSSKPSKPTGEDHVGPGPAHPPKSWMITDPESGMTHRSFEPPALEQLLAPVRKAMLEGDYNLSEFAYAMNDIVVNCGAKDMCVSLHLRPTASEIPSWKKLPAESPVIEEQKPGDRTLLDIRQTFNRILLIQEERGAEHLNNYGPSTENHRNLGEVWTAMIQHHYGIRMEHPLPASVVLLMMVALKAIRGCRGGYLEDTFDDLTSYNELARNARIEGE